MAQFETINWAFVTPILVIQLILLAIALTDCLRSKNVNGPKWLWVIVIVFFSLIGPVLYFVLGRKRS